MSTELIDETISRISPANRQAWSAAEQRQGQLTKPPGSLGALETLGNRLAGITGTCPPHVPTRPVIGIFGGDHGIWNQGVTPWPQEVTAQMLMNIAHGGAAINVLARQVGAELRVTNVGVAADLPPLSGVRDAVVGRGTRDFSQGPAMSRAEAAAAVEVGIDVAGEAVDEGADILLTGEMGIGNTTPATAMIAVFTQADVAGITGRGAGAPDDMLAHKIHVVEEALRLHAPPSGDPLRVLETVGGFEHAALAGFILGGAARRVPVIIDGVIAASAACTAAAFNPAVRDFLVAGHAGAEPAIQIALAHLGLTPLIDLGLRLGEGSGAAMALPLVQAAARLLGEMATFADAGISSGTEQ